jgi:hypothetical protein
LISLTYTLIYSARTDLDPDIPADIPGNAIRELADRLVKEARQAEEARLRLELVVLALQRLKPVGESLQGKPVLFRAHALATTPSH